MGGGGRKSPRGAKNISREAAAPLLSAPMLEDQKKITSFSLSPD